MGSAVRRVWVDANVVLRFFTGHPLDLAERARTFMEQVEKGEVQACLSPLVVAEVVWVLRSFYKQPMDRIAQVLVPFIHAEGIWVEHPELTIEALELAATKGVDFADAYLALWAQHYNEPVCTFDRTDFRKLPCQWVEPPLG